jgi:hypothetical protein
LSDLLVLLPVRHRRENAIACAKSFAATVRDAEMLIISDADDGSYDDIEWPQGVRVRVMPEWMPYVPKINTVAMELAPRYKALFAIGDDCIFETPGWDRILMGELEAMGGTGILYPENHRRNDLPEQWMTSTDITQALGWFANPALSHYYTDNTWAEIGRRSGCLKFCPEAVIRHHHYSADKGTRYDEIYSTTEQQFGARDAQAFQEWRAGQMNADVAAVKKLLAAKGAGYKFTMRSANGIAGPGTHEGTAGAVREAAEVLQGDH